MNEALPPCGLIGSLWVIWQYTEPLVMALPNTCDSQLPILCIQPLYGGQPLSHAGPITCTGYNVQYRVMTLQLCFLTDPSALKRESKMNTDLPHKKPKLQ